MPSRRLQDMSSRRLQDVFSVTIFRLPRRLQDVFKTFCEMSSRRFQDVLEDEKLLRWRRVEDVFKTCLEDVFKKSWRPTSVCWEITHFLLWNLRQICYHDFKEGNCGNPIILKNHLPIPFYWIFLIFLERKSSWAKFSGAFFLDTH